MKKFLLLTKTLFVVTLLCIGATNAWGQVSSWTATSGTYTKGQEIKGSTEGVIVMTLGNDNAWTYDSGRKGIVARTQQSPTITDGIPTAGCYVVITPVRTLQLSMLSYSSMSNCNVYMYEGTTKKKDFRQKGDNTNDYGKLDAGKTYYIYGGSYKSTGDLEYVFFKNFTATTYETYTIHYVDDSATPVTIKEDRVVSGESLYGTTVSAEESDLANIEYNENTYAYKSGNTPITLSTSGNEITLVFAKATAANVKVKYTANIADVETEIKDAVNIESAVGATVTATGENLPTYITYSDVKYKYSSGNNPLTVTGVAEDDVITLVYTPAPIYSYEVNAYDGSDNKLADISSGSYVEGDAAVSVAYPRWTLSGTTLYSCGSGSVTYSTSFTPNVDNYEKKITYNSGTVSNVVFYTEGEDVTGASVGANAARASKGQMGHTGSATTYKDATTLSPGKYQIYMRTQNGNSASRAYNFKVGENVVYTGSFGNGTNTDANSEVFTVNENSTLSFASEGSGASGIDYFYVVKTGDATVSKTITAAGWATYCSPYALDFSGVAGLTAYKVTGTESGSTLALETVTTVPANTGVLLEGTAGAYNIPVIASADAITGNKLVGVVDSEVLTANNGFVLMGSPQVGFYKNNKDFTLTANTAYLPANFAGGEVTARSAYFFGGDITGVANVEAAAEAVQKDGKFFKNGKLVIFKNGKKFNAAGAQVK